MTHPLVKAYAEAARIRTSLHFVIVSASQVRWVQYVQVEKCVRGFRVICFVSPWWWLLLGAWHLVVRRRVKRNLMGVFLKWPDPGVVSVWVR